MGLFAVFCRKFCGQLSEILSFLPPCSEMAGFGPANNYNADKIFSLIYENTANVKFYFITDWQLTYNSFCCPQTITGNIKASYLSIDVVAQAHKTLSETIQYSLSLAINVAIPFNFRNTSSYLCQSLPLQLHARILMSFAIILNNSFSSRYCSKLNSKQQLPPQGIMISVDDSIVTTAICLTGIALNGFVVASLVHDKRTKVPFDITLISLAASDAITALAINCLVLFLYFQPYSTNRALYMTLYFQVISASGLSSAFHMIFIAAQRVIAVSYPFKLSIWITKKRCIMCICVLWFASIAAAVPLYYQIVAYRRLVAYNPVVCACSFTLCYIFINYRMVTRKQLPGRRNATQNLHTLLYSITVTAIFVGCTLPLTIEKIIDNNAPLSRPSSYLYLIQVVINPIAYFIFHFLKEKKCIVCCKMRPCHQQQQNEQQVGSRVHQGVVETQN